MNEKLEILRGILKDQNEILIICSIEKEHHILKQIEATEEQIKQMINCW